MRGLVEELRAEDHVEGKSRRGGGRRGVGGEEVLEISVESPEELSQEDHAGGGI